MLLKNIALKDLAVNRANDRHGELTDEDAAIEWLLVHRELHMRNLARDTFHFRTVCCVQQNQVGSRSMASLRAQIVGPL